VKRNDLVEDERWEGLLVSQRRSGEEKRGEERRREERRGEETNAKETMTTTTTTTSERGWAGLAVDWVRCDKKRLLPSGSVAAKAHLANLRSDVLEDFSRSE
jgi:hypothetical protein